MDTLVSSEWLSQHLDDPDLVLLDCSVCTLPDDELGLRNVSGRPDYESGHIPTAGFADIKGDLCDTNSPVEFAVPTPEQLSVTIPELFCTILIIRPGRPASGGCCAGLTSTVRLYSTVG